MATSVNSVLSSSSNNIDGKKSLFLLRKIMKLSELGYKTLNDNELNNTVKNLIDVYLTTADQGSDSIKKELQGLALVRPNLANYTIKEVFHAALSELAETKLDKTQEKYINQIYIKQFLDWIQEETKHLPVSSILLLLNVYYGFNDLSTDLDTSIWTDLLSLKWSPDQKKSLNQFKSKYESLNFCVLKTSSIKIENATHSVESIKELKDLYMLWISLTKMLIDYCPKEHKNYFAHLLSISKKCIKKESKTSSKEFITNARKVITQFLPRFEQIKNKYMTEIFERPNFTFLKLSSKHLGFLEGGDNQAGQTTQKSLKNNLQDFLQKIDKGIQQEQKNENALECCLQKIQNRDESENHLFNEDFSVHKKEIQVERVLKIKERSFSSIILLGEWILNLLEEEDRSITQLEQKNCTDYEAVIKKSKNSFKKHSISPKKSLAKIRSFVEDFSIASENINVKDSEEETSVRSFSDSTLENIAPFNEKNEYLINLKQINGALSQVMDRFLQTLQAHLLKIETADDLKDQCDLQTKEIFNHLLLGTAGLELFIQAVHNQKTDHIALGFRTTLLHCYYAIEQKLSQRSIETNEILDKTDLKHNLLYLAEKTHITDIKKWQQFLQEMTLHLAFSYPEDYRLFFQQEHELKAFSFLDDLSDPGFDNKKVKEIIEFCFEMYSKSIAFIAEVSSAQIEDQSRILSIIQDLKKKVMNTL